MTEPAPSSPQRIARSRRWVLLLTVAAALAVGVVLAVSAGDGPAPTPTAGPEPTETPTASDPATGGEGDEGGGLLDSLLGGDVQQLAQCMAPSGASDTEPLPEDVGTAIDVIAEQVAADRELAFTSPVEPELLEPSAMRARVEEMTREDYDDRTATTDARLLAALGVLDADVDLQALTLELLGEQVAGFYDPDTGELTAIASDGLDPVAQITLAHELDHALTDQAIGLPDLDGPAGRGDERSAALAVVEGDASLLMQRWAARHLGLGELLSLGTGAVAPTDSLDAAPWLLQQDLVFPYTAGLAFVCEQFVDGGWGAVDALYEDLPRTTAQVLWPERYERGEVAVDVDAPHLPSDDWEPLREDQLGATDLLWLLQAPGDDRGQALDRPEERARAWAGGRLAVTGRDGDTAVGLVLAEHRDAPEPLCESVRTWYERSSDDDRMVTEGARTTWTGPDQSAVLQCPQDRVRLGIGPDVSTAAAVVD